MTGRKWYSDAQNATAVALLGRGGAVNIAIMWAAKQVFARWYCPGGRLYVPGAVSELASPAAFGDFEVPGECGARPALQPVARAPQLAVRAGREAQARQPHHVVHDDERLGLEQRVGAKLALAIISRGISRGLSSIHRNLGY